MPRHQPGASRMLPFWIAQAKPGDDVLVETAVYLCVSEPLWSVPAPYSATCMDLAIFRRRCSPARIGAYRGGASGPVQVGMHSINAS